MQTKPRVEFLNYFGKDRRLHQWLAEQRTKLIAAVIPRFLRLGVVPDTISYLGLALLTGVIIFFVRDPKLACVFLAGHVVCDGLDGAYARHTGKASQAGAFTDLVCDQCGMLIVAMLVVFHQLAPPLLGMVYIAFYLIVVVFGVLINLMGIGTRITITSKYFLYICYALWAFRDVNYFTELMSFFSAIMAVEVVVGYFRLKRGIRKKYDTPVRFTEGDPYTSRLNYALNVAAPALALLAIVVGANRTPIAAMLDRPTGSVEWVRGSRISLVDDDRTLLGLGVYEGDLMVALGDGDGPVSIHRLTREDGESKDRFIMPRSFIPEFRALPAYDGVALAANRSTHVLMGLDLKASFEAGRGVLVLSLPLGHLKVTAMAATRRNGRDVWLAANYLYTRKTYLIDPNKAREEGALLKGEEGSYVNGAFPSGLTVWNGRVIELNHAPFNSLVYVAPLDRLERGETLLEARSQSFRPPERDALGPVIQGDDLVMLTRTGRVYRLPLTSLVK